MPGHPSGGLGLAIHSMAPAGQASMHRPQASQRPISIDGFSRWQSTSMVMQYFTHFAQQMLSGSKMAPRGHTGMHRRQSVHLMGSIDGREEGASLLIGVIWPATYLMSAPVHRQPVLSRVNRGPQASAKRDSASSPVQWPRARCEASFWLRWMAQPI